ncbi:hypothetical protein HYH02_014018 [Chlamydomonas schloesseri]|uniref:Chaperone DnaJ C-terminal domain-containing protein n=1 Tax=Chlamydomonas schloesseri TaxID=2026947 RepID=A0A835T0B7_9CHLO|nr:hypothetical protein HYH02_014018 [Chlamydomonas schloesseri]|eukprot:KAG2429680.1 hypothetical protein HYH02_014018 [Chlamydomonas schloesseri]
MSAGDEEPGVIAADIVFVIDEKPHPRFSGKGMPVTKEPGAFGNMVLKFDVKFPRELSDATKQQLRSILPAY